MRGAASAFKGNSRAGSALHRAYEASPLSPRAIGAIISAVFIVEGYRPRAVLPSTSVWQALQDATTADREGTGTTECRIQDTQEAPSRLSLHHARRDQDRSLPTPPVSGRQLHVAGASLRPMVHRRKW